MDGEGRIVEAGVAGELVTRGYSTMLGYWEDKEKTEEVIGPDRWFHTGDVAVIDQAGYGQIVGRMKDMIIRGGENIYPREIEEFLHTHPAVSEAQVATNCTLSILWSFRLSVYGTRGWGRSSACG